MVIFHGSVSLPEGIVHRVTPLVSPALVRPVKIPWHNWYTAIYECIEAPETRGKPGNKIGISACNMGVSENGIYPNMALWKGTVMIDHQILGDPIFTQPPNG